MVRNLTPIIINIFNCSTNETILLLLLLPFPCMDALVTLPVLLSHLGCTFLTLLGL